MAGLWILILVMAAIPLLAQGVIVNIARGKPASTTSGQFTSWSPGKAVDGDSDINGEWKTCFHADRTPSDLTVDLEQEYQLYDIRVYIRNKFNRRTANSIIYLDNNSSRVCYTFPPVISDNPTDVKCNGTARNVTIRNPGMDEDDDILNICEVEIYVCSDETYGMDCNTTCGNCADPPCDRWTGVCNGDCRAGWRGPRCNTACGNTSYGISCTERCADRKCANSSVPCDHISGSCDTECIPGWKGVDCTDKCGRQTYGVNCSSLCLDRYCDGKSSCNHVTGSCDKGCVGGWTGFDCRQECDEKHYGPDCSKMCATRHCEGNSSCSPSTGGCNEGCQTGWTGIDCTVENQVANPKSDGVSAVAIVGAVLGVVILVLTLILILGLLIRQRRSKMTSQSKEQVYDSSDGNTKCKKEPTNVYQSLGCNEENRKTAELVESQGQHGEATRTPESRSADNQDDTYECLSTDIQERPDLPEDNYYDLVDKQ